MNGRVISIHKTGACVEIEGRQEFCLLKCEEVPVVNDIAVIEKREDKFFVKGIEPRRNFVARYDFYKDRYQGFAANVDTAFIVTSANREFSAGRIERFLKLLDGQGIRTILVVTKVDVCSEPSKFKMEGVECVQINALDKAECARLLDFIVPGGTGLLLGSSGVGKSTIINALCGLNLKTNEVQAERLGNKGKHTTSARTMYNLDDGRRIIDTPGVKIVGVEGDSNLRR